MKKKRIIFLITFLFFISYIKWISDNNVQAKEAASEYAESESNEGDSGLEKEWNFAAADLGDMLLKTRSEIYDITGITEEQIQSYDKQEAGNFAENMTVDAMVNEQRCRLQFCYDDEELLIQLNCIFPEEGGYSQNPSEQWRIAAETVELLQEKWKDEMGVTGNTFRMEKEPDFTKQISKRKSFFMNDGNCYNFSFDSYPVNAEEGTCDIIISFAIVRSDYASP